MVSVVSTVTDSKKRGRIVEEVVQSKEEMVSPMSNPNFGVFDIETFEDIDNEGDNYSRVYALGFITTKLTDLKTYFLTDSCSNTVEGSAELVLKCLDDMLVPVYDKFIFYVHNLGRYDVVFIYKILLDYNSKFGDKYILEAIYRDSQIIRLTVKLKIKDKKFIKIVFVDSLNILNNSLAKLCIDYGVKTIKGIFPYSFVNKNNLKYIGAKPGIEFYCNSGKKIVLYIILFLQFNGICVKKL